MVIVNQSDTKNYCEMCKGKETSYLTISENVESYFLCNGCKAVLSECGLEYLKEYTARLKGQKRISSKICKVEGCSGNVQAKDLCSKHYKQLRRHGKITG